MAKNYTRIQEFINGRIQDELSRGRRSIEETIESLPIICGTECFDRAIPSRDPANKYYIDRKEYSLNYWPKACAGQMYVMPVKVAGELFDASRTSNFVTLEDVWVTGVLRRKLGQEDNYIVASGLEAKQQLGRHLVSSFSKVEELKVQMMHLQQIRELKRTSRCVCLTDIEDEGALKVEEELVAVWDRKPDQDLLLG